jgi:Zn-dependent protease
MSGSIRIATFAGIGVYVHWTFLILLGWVGFTYYARGNDMADAIHGIVFILALFGVIVLHEFGHALSARRYGIPTRDITLLPIGGVARLEGMPEKPSQELVVALAGPAVNVVLAILCFVLLQALAGVANFGTAMENGIDELGFVMEDYQQVPMASESSLIGADFLSRMLVVNVMLVAFNMLPAFPMDGGRVLRALLAMTTDYVRATRVAATVGQALAILLGFAGLFFNPFLVFIALFVWMGASSEASAVQLKAALQGIPVLHAMITDFKTVSPDSPLAEASRYVVAGCQHDFPVVDSGQVVGVLTKTDLLKSLTEHGPDQLVGNVMRREFLIASPSDMLVTVFHKLQTCQCHTVPVVRHDELVGIVTMENVGEYLAIRGAMGTTQAIAR